MNIFMCNKCFSFFDEFLVNDPQPEEMVCPCCGSRFINEDVTDEDIDGFMDIIFGDVEYWKLNCIILDGDTRVHFDWQDHEDKKKELGFMLKYFFVKLRERQ